MDKRFTALRIIATLYKIAGVIVAILVILGVIFTVISQPVVDLGLGINLGRQAGGLGIVIAIFAAIVELLAGGLTALGIYAVGELLYLLINVEENTRFTALVIRDRMAPVPPAPQSQAVPPAAPAPMPPPVVPPSYEPPTYQAPPPYEPPES